VVAFSRATRTGPNMLEGITFAALPGAVFGSLEAVDEYAWVALSRESAIGRPRFWAPLWGTRNARLRSA
jgi:hypothetical protein